MIDITPAPVGEISAAPAAEPADAPEVARNPAAEADHFARTTLRPSQAGQVKIVEIPAAYRSWCSDRGLQPLPDKVIGPALSDLFSSVGLYRRGKSDKAVVEGIKWRSSGPVDGAQRRLTAASPPDAAAP